MIVFIQYNKALMLEEEEILSAHGDPQVNVMAKYMGTLQMRHTTDLSDLLMGRHLPFAGDIYIDENGQMEHLGEFLPRNVIPMRADFDLPYSDHFCAKMIKAQQYVNDRRKYRGDADKPFLVVPIESNGGNIELLKQMLATMDSVRCSTGVQIVAYLSGTVASCAFILAQTCDHIVTDNTAMMLCHDPSQSRMVPVNKRDGTAYATQTAGQAAMVDMELELTHNTIYQEAELGILIRYMSTHKDQNVLTDGEKWQHNSLRLLESLLNNPLELKVWREKYFKDHEVSLNRMHALMMKEKVKLTYSPEMNILDFITRDVALDRNGFEIRTEWLKELDIVDAINVRVRLAQEDHCEITRSLRTQVMAKLAKVDEETLKIQKERAAETPAPEIQAPERSLEIAPL